MIDFAKTTPDECPTCHDEGYVGTGLSNSFVDVGDAMPCPTCSRPVTLVLDEPSEREIAEMHPDWSGAFPTYLHGED